MKLCLQPGVEHRIRAIVLGNRGDDAALPALHTALLDDDPIVRGHAAWAIGQIRRADPQLLAARSRETDERVRAEIDAALHG